MTFFKNEKDIIKKCTYNNSNYHITYLDGTISNYTYYDKTHKNKLEEKMIKQAKKRDELFYEKLKKKIIKINQSYY